MRIVEQRQYRKSALKYERRINETQKKARTRAHNLAWLRDQDCQKLSKVVISLPTPESMYKSVIRNPSIWFA
jgi:hypothetical protein